jgi:hypothetical protein
MREIVKIGEYIKKCNKQMEIVRNTEFVKLVIVDKNPWIKPVEYDVVLHCIPLIRVKGVDMIYDKSHYRKFIGNSKEAMAYAEDLAKEHKAKIITKDLNQNITMTMALEEEKCTT